MTLRESLIILVLDFSINCEKKRNNKKYSLSVDSISKVVQSGQQKLEILHDISFKLER